MTRAPLLPALLATLAIPAALLSCRGDSRPGAADSPAAGAPAAASDPGLAEAIRRFRADSAPTPVTSFTPAVTSRDSLVLLFVEAVERGDEAALRALRLTPGEFAWLYYETDPRSRPPERLDPLAMWGQIGRESEDGVRRLLARLGGRPLGFNGYECYGGPVRQGDNQVWSECVSNFVGPDRTTMVLPLFGPIVERGGRFKFLGLANRL